MSRPRPRDERCSTGGLIRAARRPPGWRPPGPAPSGAPILPGPGEDLCYLLGDWRIFQRLDGHRWSLDDLVTAWMAADTFGHHQPARICDLGCGIGSVLLMLAFCFPRTKLVGVEAQALSVGLCRRSIQYNGAEDRVEVRQGDLRDPRTVPERGAFDLVSGTPPYLPTSQGVISDRPQRGPCRFELRGGVEAYFEAAARLMTSTGSFVVCEDARQIDRVEATARASGLLIQKRLDVVPRAEKPPLFSVFRCRFNAPENPRIDTLVVRDRAGQRTPKFLALRSRMGLPH